MTEAPATATAALVLTRGWLPGVRTARVVVDAGPPQRLRAGEVLTFGLGPGAHEVRVLAGGARSHLHRVLLRDVEVRQLVVGLDRTAGAPALPALLGNDDLGDDDRSVATTRLDGVPLDESWWPFWAFLLGVVAPPVGLVVAVLALRRPGLSSVSRGLVVTGLAAAVGGVLAVVLAVARVLTATG